MKEIKLSSGNIRLRSNLREQIYIYIYITMNLVEKKN